MATLVHFHRHVAPREGLGTNCRLASLFISLQNQRFAFMRSLGPWLKFSLMAWAISAAIIIIGFFKGFDDEPLPAIGRNLAGALLIGLLFDWLRGASEDPPQSHLQAEHQSRPSRVNSPRPVRQGSPSLQRSNPAIAHYREGRVHAKNGDLVRAIESFSRALRFNPIYVDALISRGIALQHSGDYENAIADLSEALAIDPRNAQAYSYRGTIHHKFGDYAGAVADYDQSLRLDPKQEIVRGARRLAEERLTEAGR
jgi:tetratricopeptide (TPR) repeat protein